MKHKYARKYRSLDVLQYKEGGLGHCFPIMSKQNSFFEEIVLPLLSFSDKFALTGSRSLLALDLDIKRSDYDNSDIDISLTEPLNEEELSTIIDFFNLYIKPHSQDDYRDSEDNNDTSEEKEATSIVKRALSRSLIQLFKTPPKEEPTLMYSSYTFTVPFNMPVTRSINMNSILSTTLSPYLHQSLPSYSDELPLMPTVYKVDIFNKEYVSERDIIYMMYEEFRVKIVHPSITLAAKTKYSLDIRNSSQFKHFTDIKRIYENTEQMKKYFKFLKDYESLKSIKFSF